MMASGGKIIHPSKKVCEHTAKQFDLRNKPMGGLEWPALIRQLDAVDQSYRD